MSTPQIVEAVLSSLLILVGTSQLLNRNAWVNALSGIVRHPSLPIFMGIYALLLGLVIVGAHPAWNGMGVITTLVGWWCVVMGGVCLMVPRLMSARAARLHLRPALVLMGGSIRLVLGLLIGYEPLMHVLRA